MLLVWRDPLGGGEGEIREVAPTPDRGSVCFALSTCVKLVRFVLLRVFPIVL